MDLHDSAQSYAEQMAEMEGCVPQHRVNGDTYGTQNLGVSRGLAMSPEEVLTAWHDNEIEDNLIDLKGKRFHATQVLFRSSKYVGCGVASKPDPDDNNQFCHFYACRYVGSGNCFLEAFIDVYPSFASMFPFQDPIANTTCFDLFPDNYWICSVLSDSASTICQEPPHLPMHPKDGCP